MEFRRFDTQADLDDAAAAWMIRFLARPGCRAALATGNSPTGAYARVTGQVAAGAADLSRATAVMLDEYLGLPADHPKSCKAYLEEHAVRPWGIKNFVAIDPLGDGFGLDDFRSAVSAAPLDLAVIGIGVNGHIGMNEPAASHVAGPLVADLAESTTAIAAANGILPAPVRGVTLGVDDICRAGSVLLLVSGGSKREAFRRLKEPVIDPWFPASYLWLARDVCVMHCNVE